MNMERQSETDPPHFKECGACGIAWESRDEFLSDPGVKLVGYQVNFGELVAGAFLFNHSCASTLAVRAGRFRDLYDGPIFEVSVAGSDECPGYCLRQTDLEPCPVKCECAYVREIIQIIRDYEKR